MMGSTRLNRLFASSSPLYWTKWLNLYILFRNNLNPPHPLLITPDGTSSSYSTSTTASDAWSSTGQKYIIVTARCQTHTSISNNNSPGQYVTVQPPPETITVPGSITGEPNPIQGTSYSYSVGPSTSSLGHTVEYSFNWGDGTSSSWSTSTSASHAWSSTGQKYIIVTARCQTHTSISNNNSPGQYVTVQPQPQPILTVTQSAPPTQPAAAGSLNLSVNNTGSGTMTYSASVTSGSSWLS